MIQHLLPKGWKLRALTRNPEGEVGRRLAGRGVEVIRGGLEDPVSLERGLRSVYSVQDFWAVGARREGPGTPKGKLVIVVG